MAFAISDFKPGSVFENIRQDEIFVEKKKCKFNAKGHQEPLRIQGNTLFNSAPVTCSILTRVIKVNYA